MDITKEARQKITVVRNKLLNDVDNKITKAIWEAVNAAIDDMNEFTEETMRNFLRETTEMFSAEKERLEEVASMDEKVVTKKEDGRQVECRQIECRHTQPVEQCAVTQADLSIEFFGNDGNIFIPLPRKLWIPVGDGACKDSGSCCCEVCKFMRDNSKEYTSCWDTMTVNPNKHTGSISPYMGHTGLCHFPAMNRENTSILPTNMVRRALNSVNEDMLPVHKSPMTNDIMGINENTVRGMQVSPCMEDGLAWLPSGTHKVLGAVRRRGYGDCLRVKHMTDIDVAQREYDIPVVSD